MEEFQDETAERGAEDRQWMYSEKWRTGIGGRQLRDKCVNAYRAGSIQFVVRFQALTAENLKMGDFWCGASCRFIEIGRRFGRQFL
jgi:hypothetical protein